MPFRIFQAEASSILSATSGFIRDAGFTHSLTPARNCTFGCSYCYVPTMGIYGGLKADDWRHWGEFTTVKSNAVKLLAKGLRADQVIYCSPLVDPYQPAEADFRAMPGILGAVAARPPAVFVVQTRGPSIERDLEILSNLKKRTTLRVSFSLTTNREGMRRIFESGCAPVAERLGSISKIRAAGIEVHATLAPILPCDPEELIAMAAEATDGVIIGDPFHVRAVKRQGATTREAAVRIADRHGMSDWFVPEFQAEVLERMRAAAARVGREFAVGIDGFRRLAVHSITCAEPSRQS